MKRLILLFIVAFFCFGCRTDNGQLQKIVIPHFEIYVDNNSNPPGFSIEACPELTGYLLTLKFKITNLTDKEVILFTNRLRFMMCMPENGQYLPTLLSIMPDIEKPVVLAPGETLTVTCPTYNLELSLIFDYEEDYGIYAHISPFRNHRNGIIIKKEKTDGIKVEINEDSFYL